MELKSRGCTIKVDDKGFTLSPVARSTLEAIASLIMCVGQTGLHQDAQVGVLETILKCIRKDEMNKHGRREIGRYYAKEENGIVPDLPDMPEEPRERGWEL